jgi:hypothetical protein
MQIIEDTLSAYYDEEEKSLNVIIVIELEHPNSSGTFICDHVARILTSKKFAVELRF